MKFINPYNFVRTGNVIRGHASEGGHRFSGWTGRLTCRLHILTPTLTVGVGNGHCLNQPVNERHEPVIPAAALRGMVRSVFKTVTWSCGANPWGFGNSALVRPCGDPADCCLACRLFGMVANDRQQSGMVRFTDALGQLADLKTGAFHLPREGAPRKRHRPFYQNGAHQPRGRKFYYHHLPQPASPPRHKSTIASCLKTGSILNFAVSFSGLNETDLLTLIYALVLEPPMGHKLGHGKPLGLGSCRVTLKAEGSTLENEPERIFQQFQKPVSHVTPKLLKILTEKSREFVGNNPALKDTLTDLRVIFRLYPNHPDHCRALPFQYPDEAWFWYDRNSLQKVPLPTTLQVENNIAMLEESPVGRILRLGKNTKPYRKHHRMEIRKENCVFTFPDKSPIELTLKDILPFTPEESFRDMGDFFDRFDVLVRITGVSPLEKYLKGIVPCRKNK